VAACVLDRAADEADFAREADRFRGGAGRIAEAFLQIRGHRQVGSRHDGARMRQSFLARDAAMAPLEVASAANPSPARIRAEPASQALAMRKAPGPSCSFLNRSAFSVCVAGMGSPSGS